jgi:hypothetical protein
VKGQPNRFLAGHFQIQFAKTLRPIIHGLSRKGKIDKRYRMWKGSRKHARAQGLIWDLRLDDIPIIPDVCPVLGIPIDNHSKTRCANSPSLDKVVPSLGYVPGNVRIISWRANDLKKDASLNELEKLVKYVREHITHEQNS